MTEEKARLISTLLHDPAYNALLEHLDDEVTGMLGALAEAKSPGEVMRLTRLWQIAVKIAQTLRKAPESMTAHLAQLKDDPSVEQNFWDIHDDPFAHRTLPPTYQDSMYRQNAKITLETE